MMRAPLVAFPFPSSDMVARGLPGDFEIGALACSEEASRS